MSQQNRKQFDNYSDDSYYKTNEKAVKRFRCLYQFPEALGFDDESGGYIILNKKHKPGGLHDEIPVCLILKKLGLGIELISEDEIGKVLDVTISEISYEIKRIKQTKNLLNSVTVIFRATYKKAKRLIFHIDTKIEPNNLKRALRIVSEKYGQIKIVWIVYEGKLTILNKDDLREGKYRL